jgi:hypothetical protein
MWVLDIALQMEVEQHGQSVGISDLMYPSRNEVVIAFLISFKLAGDAEPDCTCVPATHSKS